MIDGLSRSPREMLRAAVAAVALATGLCSAQAATINLAPENPREPDASRFSIWLRGEIQPGDAGRLQQLARQAKASGRGLFAVYLDSPGGSLIEGIRLGQTIRDEGAVTVLVSRSTCASACVLAFAGGIRKLAFRGARLGVHGASEGGEETTRAMAGTLQMARLAAQLGVPDPIITKIITTPPHLLSWLTVDEIGSVTGRGVVDMEAHGGEDGSALRRPGRPQ